MVTGSSDARLQKDNVTSLAKKGKKENLGNCGPVSFTLDLESDEASHPGNQGH